MPSHDIGAIEVSLQGLHELTTSFDRLREVLSQAQTVTVAGMWEPSRNAGGSALSTTVSYQQGDYLLTSVAPSREPRPRRRRRVVKPKLWLTGPRKIRLREDE